MKRLINQLKCRDLFSDLRVELFSDLMRVELSSDLRVELSSDLMRVELSSDLRRVQRLSEDTYLPT